MKKIRLSVPAPCHENWESMRPEDRGRFCGSCQKTVIDFTGMSDRQLAEFFKKPAASLCGRFHNDQLNRAIEIPKKRLPWVKYFFTIALPAFLASCKFAGRQATVGEMEATEQHTVGDTTIALTPPSCATVGMILLPDVTRDSFPVMGKPALPKEEAHTEGNIEVVQVGPTRCDAEFLPPIPHDTLIKEGLPMDTVAIISYSNRPRNMIMGGVSTLKADGNIQQNPERLPERPAENFEVVAYPNPVRAGGLLTISARNGNDEPKRVHLISSSGALVALQQPAFFKGKNISLPLPSDLSAGTYFLRLVSKDGQSSTVKIVVLN